MFIKLFQTDRIWQTIGAEIIDLANTMHQRGYAQNGPLTPQLEETLATMLNRKHCITTGCGTDALDIAIQSLNLSSGSNVAVSNYTFTASAHAIKRAGHNVLPVDVDDNYCIDANKVPQGSQAIVAVDLFGNMSDYARLEQLNIPIVVDAAQSLESIANNKYSASHGLISCVSFSPSKTISSWGSGGAILTDDDDLAAKCRRLRLHGKLKNDNDAIAPGLNSMMSSFEVAAVLVGLKYSPKWQERRNSIAHYLKDQSVHCCANDFSIDKNTLSKLVFQSNNRAHIINRARDIGVEFAIHYNKCVNDETIYHSEINLDNSIRLKNISFTVPNQHTLTDNEVELIAKALR